MRLDARLEILRDQIVVLVLALACAAADLGQRRTAVAIQIQNILHRMKVAEVAEVAAEAMPSGPSLADVVAVAAASVLVGAYPVAASERLSAVHVITPFSDTRR